MSDESAKSVVKPAVSRTDKRAEKFRDAIRRPILEKRYMNARLDGKGMVESAQIAGFEGADLRTPGKRIETPELKRQMQEALLRQGLTLDRIAEKVADAMDATAYATFQGVVTGSDVPDHSVRMKAVEQASKLFGLSESERGADAGATLTLTLNGALAERIAARMCVPDAKVIDSDCTR